MSTSKPLLDLEGGVEREWDRLEALPRDMRAITVQQLIAQDPNNVLANIKAGIVKLGEFQVEDTLLFAALAGRPMLTMGARSVSIDYERLWRQELAVAAGNSSRSAQPQEQHAGRHVGGGGGSGGAAGWSRMVTAEAFVVRIRNAAHPDSSGLIRPLLMRYHAGACHYSVFGLPAVQAVLQFKWDSFCHRALLAELACFLTWLAGFSVFVLLWQDENPKDTLSELVGTRRGAVTVAAEVIALVAMVPFLFIEASTLMAYSFMGWASVWNLLDIATYVLQVIIVVLHLGRIGLEDPATSGIVAAQVVLLFFRLNYFSRLFVDRFSFLDTLQRVVVDCKCYFGFLGLMMFGFAASFYVLFRNDQHNTEFSDISHSLLTVLKYALGGVNLDTMLNCSNPGAVMTLSIIYQFSMSMVLMNLLVGMMCSSMTQASDHQELKALLTRAEVVDEVESTVPSWIEERMPSIYPAFVHVLRVDPGSLEARVELSDSAWQGGGGSKHAPGSGGDDAGRERQPTAAGSCAAADSGALGEVRQELSDLKAQVAALNFVLRGAVPLLPAGR